MVRAAKAAGEPPGSGLGRSGIGAQRKHVTLATDFRLPSENGHSRYGHRTARFAPQATFTTAGFGLPHWVDSGLSSRLTWTTRKRRKWARATAAVGIGEGRGEA